MTIQLFDIGGVNPTCVFNAGFPYVFHKQINKLGPI